MLLNLYLHIAVTYIVWYEEHTEVIVDSFIPNNNGLQNEADMQGITDMNRR